LKALLFLYLKREHPPTDFYLSTLSLCAFFITTEVLANWASDGSGTPLYTKLRI